MRYLPRISLPARVNEQLAAYQDKLEKRTPAAGGRQIEEFWEARRDSKALKAVEIALRAMASGLARCMYCEDSQGCDIEHSHPKARYPERTYVWPNLLWICAPCNRQKNGGFEDGMINPTLEDPLDHLALSFTRGRYTARDDSPRGEATLRVVRRVASDPDLTRGRIDAVVKLRNILSNYEQFVASGDLDAAEENRRAVVRAPFSAVFAAVLRAVREPNAGKFLGETLVGVISRHPAMYDWLKEADAERVAAVMPDLAGYASELRIRRSP